MGEAYHRAYVFPFFYDFYGFKARNGCNVEELEAEIGKLFSNSRLISYVQQYEFEALIFAVPESAVEWLEGRTQQREEMQNAVQKAGSPEKVNDRFEADLFLTELEKGHKYYQL